MAGRIIRVVAVGLFLATGWARAEWDTLENCQLIESEWNDADSFHVRHAGKEYIFRLCYVDTPEVKGRKGQTERTTAQARYWKILKRDMYPLAKEASAYTATVLGKNFAVKTQWVDAKGASQLPRNFGVIMTSRGDLAELLVGNGYARIYGFSPDYPGGIPAKKYREKLEALESSAREKELGAWAYSKKSKESGTKNSGGSPSRKTATDPVPAESGNGLDTIPLF